MNWYRNQYRQPVRIDGFIVTIALIGLNLLVFAATMINRELLIKMALIPAFVVYENAWWQVFTYMFVHGGYGHIFFNMFILFTFGYTLEKRMGSVQFLLFYLVCGIGVGLITLLINFNTGLAMVPTIGASGAIYGLLLAYAAFFPDAQILLFFVLPLRAPLAILVSAGLSVFFEFTGLFPGVAHLAHLSGLVLGFFYMLIFYRVNAFKEIFRR